MGELEWRPRYSTENICFASKGLVTCLCLCLVVLIKVCSQARVPQRVPRLRVPMPSGNSTRTTDSEKDLPSSTSHLQTTALHDCSSPHSQARCRSPNRSKMPWGSEERLVSLTVGLDAMHLTLSSFTTSGYQTGNVRCEATAGLPRQLCPPSDTVKQMQSQGVVSTVEV